MPSIGTAAFIAFEWLLREADIISRLSWSDYRPPERPDCIRLRHGKTDTVIWQPLIDNEEPLFPELTARLDSSPKRGSLIVMRDTKDRRREEFLPYSEHWFRHCISRIRDHVGLPKEITFTSFRHGGMTELGDAELSDQSMMALSAHKTRAMLTVYSKRNERQRANAARKRLAHRI